MANTRQPLFSDHNDDGFNLKEFVFTYILRFWYLYVLFIGGAVGLTWLKIRYATPIYQMRGTLLIKDEYTKSSGITQEAIFQDLGLIQGGPRLLNEIQVLKSRPVMASAVKRLGLDVEYYTVGRVRVSESYPYHPIQVSLHDVNDGGYGVAFDINILDTQYFKLTLRGQTAQYQFGNMIQIPEGKFIFTLTGKDNLSKETIRVIFRKPEDAAVGYVGGLTVNLVDNYASVLEMSYKHPVPQKGIDLLNGIVEEYNRITIEDKNSVGRNTVQFIDDRLKFLTTELSDVEGELEQYKKNNEIPTEISSSVENLISQLTDFDKNLNNLEIQKTILEGLSGYLQDKLTQFEPAPINLLPENQQIATLVNRFNALVLERSRLLKNATAENPVVQNLSSQVELMRSSILETIKNTQKELELGLVRARAQNAVYQSKIRSIPTKERGLIEIKRQQGIKETLFLYLLQKREETALSLAVSVPNSRIVDPPICLGGPISPNSRSMYITALFIGLLIPSLLIYLRYLLTNTVQSESEIVQATRTPLLGAIGYKKGADPMVVKKNSRSAMAEMFRLLRTNLQFLGAGKNNQVILITSTISGEGKSFVTLNLGITLALADKKTVILELDLRKPKLVRYLTKQPSDRGLSNYLIGQIDETGLVQESMVHPNLYYIGGGPIPPNPAELLLTDKMGDLINYLRQHYDYILLDTPPVGMVADAFLLGRHADSALYVVRYGHTFKSSLGFIDEINTEQKLPSLAIIFNGVKVSGGYGYGQRYGYGYGYGYGAGYGYGYYDDVKKPKKWKIF